MKKTIILILALALVLIIVIVAKFKKQPSPQPSPQNQIESGFKQEVLVDQIQIKTSPEIPEKFSLFSASPVPFDSNVNLVIDNFQVEQNQNIPTYYRNTTTGTSVVISDHQITINTPSPSQSPLPPGIDSQKAIQTINSYLKNQAINNYQVDSKAILYIRDQEYLNQSKITPSQATFIKAPIIASLEDYPLLLDHATDTDSFVLMNSLYEVTKIVFSPLSTSFNKTEERPSINLDRAVENIMTGNYFISNLSVKNSSEKIDLINIKSLVVSSVKIEYRLNSQTNTVLPYYTLVGGGVINGHQSEIQISTPAI